MNELKDRVAVYPEELAKRMISENLWLSNRWHNREALLKRKDWLMLYDVICEVQRNIFGTLFGLNKMYVHHPAFKWMPHNVERMSIKPENLYERMANTLIEKPEYSVQELEMLIKEVLHLVEHHAPALNIAEQQNIFNMQNKRRDVTMSYISFILLTCLIQVNVEYDHQEYAKQVHSLIRIIDKPVLLLWRI